VEGEAARGDGGRRVYRRRGREGPHASGARVVPAIRKKSTSSPSLSWTFTPLQPAVCRSTRLAGPAGATWQTHEPRLCRSPNHDRRRCPRRPPTRDVQRRPVDARYRPGQPRLQEKVTMPDIFTIWSATGETSPAGETSNLHLTTTV